MENNALGEVFRVATLWEEENGIVKKNIYF